MTTPTPPGVHVVWTSDDGNWRAVRQERTGGPVGWVDLQLLDGDLWKSAHEAPLWVAEEMAGALDAAHARIAALEAASHTPDWPPGCAVNLFSSRACERGTHGCVVEHESHTPGPPQSTYPDVETYLAETAGPVALAEAVEEYTAAKVGVLVEAADAMRNLIRDLHIDKCEAYDAARRAWAEGSGTKDEELGRLLRECRWAYEDPEIVTRHMGHTHWQVVDCHGYVRARGDTEIEALRAALASAPAGDEGDAMTEHRLKTWPPFFEAIADGRKSFEVRRNARGFQVGDRLHLEEYNPNMGNRHGYTGNALDVEVTYVMGSDVWGALSPGFVVLGIRVIEEATAPATRDEGEKGVRNG